MTVPVKCLVTGEARWTSGGPLALASTDEASEPQGPSPILRPSDV